MRLPFSLIVSGFFSCVGALCAEDGVEPALPSQKAEFFEAHIRPVLAENCHACHGPKKQESGLRLDSRAAMLKGGDSGPAVVPGKPEESYLVEAIGYGGGIQMPPSGKLDENKVQSMIDWIRRGAHWPEEANTPAPTSSLTHWAFRPVVRPSLPEIENDGWSQSPVDRFVLARLLDAGLSPAAPASRSALLRRVTFDLIGLPPTPEEVTAFMADDSTDAYARLVERLLASPQYGERWARHWLDVARYADNKGYVFFEEQKYPWAFAYRDYVVQAFNDDLPYDRFVKEQLAADQLDLGGEKRRLAAMGFLTVGNHYMNNVHDILDDRIDVVTRGLMGLTVTCARCHDHKFDPIPQADYYSLYGVFRSSLEPMLPPLLDDPPNTEEYRKFDAEMNVRLAKLNEFVTAKHTELVTSSRSRAAEYLLAANAQRDQPPTDDFMLIADPGDLNPSMIVRWQALLDKTRRRRHPVWTPWHALADLPADRFAADAPAVLEKLGAAAGAGEAINPLLVKSLAEKPLSTLNDVAQRYGELLNRIDQEWKKLIAAAAMQGQPMPSELTDPDAEQLRQVFYGPNAPPDVPVISGWGFLTLLPDRAAQEEYKKVLKEVETWSTTGPGAPPRAMVLVDADTPFQPRIFQRGNPQRLGDSVPRQFLACLEADHKPFQRGSGRLELAEKIASPDNPLAARMIVNRIWMHHFGEGLVSTSGDFGLRGEPPSHPELLDWLAEEFVKRGWSIKELHRVILLSATYQQGTKSELETQSANSKLPSHSARRTLHLISRRRLEFEAMRDALLAVSGGLDPTIGGPAIDMFGGGFSPRRTIYGFIDRMDPPGLLTTFDFPNPAASSPQRQETLVSPQSLYLMNSDFVAECARRFATRPDVTALPRSERIERMYLIAFGRQPNEREALFAAEYLGGEPTAELWERFAQALLMTNEFAFVD
jgi:mono/diheme cytochrome c family protein